LDRKNRDEEKKKEKSVRYSTSPLGTATSAKKKPLPSKLIQPPQMKFNLAKKVGNYRKTKLLIVEKNIAVLTQRRKNKSLPPLTRREGQKKTLLRQWKNQ